MVDLAVLGLMQSCISMGLFKIIDDFAPRRPVKLLSNPFSWTKVASIIYVDSPAGTGYSYADSVDDYITSDTKTVADLYEFILKFFSEYPEFLPNPLYVGACSYSGVMVPPLAQEMVNGNDHKSHMCWCYIMHRFHVWEISSFVKIEKKRRT
ncbi:serine carboxypeptidase 1-like [Dioscorea cayenensis subsp. rotundata]|uniref:Serine carboxypeptidase 1-like n=1 Tax=Dioscorea cayennensis subsp. rotundata TaxID=55577 RepID=A0AB40BDA7_DIOCR|nr:serine carboxypeptidase 1-like [Dioscorea cayenensis subsp. rotundata]